MLQAFHEIAFPFSVARGVRGGPVRRTDVVTLASGVESRNARWARSRRRYDAGLGVRSLDDLHAVITFFEERRGRLIGFRLHDRTDCRSGPPGAVPGPADQPLGTGDGETFVFQLTKTYGSAFAPYTRPILKPVAGSVRVARDGDELVPGVDFVADSTTGQVTFLAAPLAGAVLTAGYAFDVPVRFDTDALDIDLSAFEAGGVPHVPMVEIVP